LNEGLLSELTPTFGSDPVRRVMLLHPIVEGFLQQQGHHPRIGRLRADLEAFVTGQEIAMSTVPYEHRTAYMGILDPVTEGVWEIRSRDPNPGMRVFGQFACKDTFIAFNVGLRSKRDLRWPELVPLGDGKSFQYHFAQIDVLNRWKALFPQLSPLSGDDASVLLSDKYHIV
jgi:hypothetical protein